MTWPTDLLFDLTWPIFELDLDIVKMIILSKFDDDLTKTVASRVLTKLLTHGRTDWQRTKSDHKSSPCHYVTGELIKRGETNHWIISWSRYICCWYAYCNMQQFDDTITTQQTWFDRNPLAFGIWQISRLLVLHGQKSYHMLVLFGQNNASTKWYQN